MKILIIEDDVEIVEAIRLAFRIRWPEAQTVSSGLGEPGLEMVEKENPDMVILDLGLPDISGYEVLKQIRTFSSVPVLILTARTEESNIVKGLEWGADDYVIKPFRQLELLSRVKALLRRRGNGEVENTIAVGNLSLNPVTGQLFVSGKEIKLTITEGRILGHLMKNAGQVATHAGLAEVVWGNDYPDAPDSIKVYIRRLREKIEPDPGNPTHIVTRPGIGYSLLKPA